MNIMRRIVSRALVPAAVTFAVTGMAHAGPMPNRLSFTLGSHHTFAMPKVAGEHWTEANPGVFLTWERRALGLDYSAGVYRNSFGDASVAAVAALPIASWHHRTLGDGQVALFGGLAHYPGRGDLFAVSVGDIVPLGGLQVRQGNFFAQVLPGKFDPVEVVVSFGMTFSLDTRNPER
jgi:hypothetical protein